MRNVIVAAFAALVTGVLSVACGNGNANLCEENEVRCEPPLSCDPADGICKCGGPGGVACGEDAACDVDTNTCLSNKCVGVSCGGADQSGYACDPQDGQCKCGGSGGPVCGQGQVCNPATKSCQPAGSCNELSCPRNMTCDPNTISCMCGTQQCAQGQACGIATDGTKACTDDACSGVQCLGTTVCDPADGRCKCNGVACQSGEVCGCPSGTACQDSERVCKSGSACATITCGNGTTCDPADGKCKCGGPGGPACGVEQVCSLQNLQCQGGNQCQTADGGAVSCSGGTSCDPEDGACKCGGRGGDLCEEDVLGEQDEICVQKEFSNACRIQCDTRIQNCPTNQGCFWDTTSKTPAAYCSVPTGSLNRGQGCNSATDCYNIINNNYKAMYCAGLGTFGQTGTTGFCRAYCDVPGGGIQCPSRDSNGNQLPPQQCTPIDGAPPGMGFCENCPAGGCLN